MSGIVSVTVLSIALRRVVYVDTGSGEWAPSPDGDPMIYTDLEGPSGQLVIRPVEPRPIYVTVEVGPPSEQEGAFLAYDGPFKVAGRQLSVGDGEGNWDSFGQMFDRTPGTYRVVVRVTGRDETVEDEERWLAMSDEESEAYDRRAIEHLYITFPEVPHLR